MNFPRRLQQQPCLDEVSPRLVGRSADRRDGRLSVASTGASLIVASQETSRSGGALPGQFMADETIMGSMLEFNGD